MEDELNGNQQYLEEVRKVLDELHDKLSDPSNLDIVTQLAQEATEKLDEIAVANADNQEVVDAIEAAKEELNGWVDELLKSYEDEYLDDLNNRISDLIDSINEGNADPETIVSLANEITKEIDNAILDRDETERANLEEVKSSIDNAVNNYLDQLSDDAEEEYEEDEMVGEAEARDIILEEGANEKKKNLKLKSM
ncbi:biological adhesion protein [Trichomonas vaginalis G3]|uniref:biological adhesion protein n=1 Tax=Trichomonas vaginalis (strain ATCC PRA-98 / G3) TaxID=412133 RepID=UPI0021E59F68|nr:biological adhesion protein [Trichomonas vaginalis G3]KAI5531757.1 biological adhesion protein [Trichomonas vaginalis G3]